MIGEVNRQAETALTNSPKEFIPSRIPLPVVPNQLPERAGQCPAGSPFPPAIFV